MTDYSRNPFEDLVHCALENVWSYLTYPETLAMKAESPIRCYDCDEKLRLGIQRNLPEARICIESGEVTRIAQLIIMAGMAVV